jgi:RNA polymerase sigma factor (sigma-70 family)
VTPKEYLEQAYRLDQFIRIKMEDVAKFHSMVTKITPTLSDMPGSSTRNVHKLEDNIATLMDMEKTTTDEITKLVALRKEIATAISTVQNPNEQLILQRRYLCGYTWERIGEEIHATERSVRRWHKNALRHITISQKN